jgi:HK97 family phage major capsid protein
MLKARRTFRHGGETVHENVTRVAEDHELARLYPDAFGPATDGPGTHSRSEIRATDPRTDRVVSGEEVGLYTESALREIEEQRQAVREAMQVPGSIERSFEPPEQLRRRDTGPGWEDRELGLRALERMELSAEAGDRLDSVIRGDRAGIDSRYIAAVSDPDYERAFWKRLASPDTAPHSYTPKEAEATRVVSEAMAERAMSEGTTTAGGFGVPYALDPTIVITGTGVANPLRELATVSTITTKTWKGVSSAGITAAFSDEAVEVGDDTPVLAQPSIDAEKWQAFIPFSIEVGEDYTNLQQELANLLADARDNLEADRFTFGTAGTEPEGILTAGTVQVTTAGTATYAVADVYSLQEAVAPRYQPNASWLMSNAIRNKTRRFVAQGSTSEPSLFNDAQDRILGKPWRELSTLVSTTTSNSLIAIYGDIQRGYRVIDRVGLSVELIPHIMGSNRRPLGQRGLYCYGRVGAGVVNAQAFRVLKIR